MIDDGRIAKHVSWFLVFSTIFIILISSISIAISEADAEIVISEQSFLTKLANQINDFFGGGLSSAEPLALFYSDSIQIDGKAVSNMDVSGNIIIFDYKDSYELTLSGKNAGKKNVAVDVWLMNADGTPNKIIMRTAFLASGSERTYPELTKSVSLPEGNVVLQASYTSESTGKTYRFNYQFKTVKSSTPSPIVSPIITSGSDIQITNVKYDKNAAIGKYLSVAVTLKNQGTKANSVVNYVECAVYQKQEVSSWFPLAFVQPKANCVSGEDNVRTAQINSLGAGEETTITLLPMLKQKDKDTILLCGVYLKCGEAHKNEAGTQNRKDMRGK